VGAGQAVGDLDRHLQRRRQVQLPLLDQTAHGGAVDELHGDESGIVRFLDLVDLRDGGMVHGGGGAGLLDEAPAAIRILDHLGLEDFQGDVASQARVARPIDDTHAPFPESFLHHVVLERATYHRRAALRTKKRREPQNGCVILSPSGSAHHLQGCPEA
jgi:hypothetical protein